MAKSGSMAWFSGLVYGSIFAVVGYFIVAHLAMAPYHLGQESKSWPTVQGRIIHSAMASSTSPQGKTTYSPDIQFTYQVNGRDYQSNQVGVEPGPGASSSSDPSAASEIVARYPVGTVVTVYYKPSKPALGVLQPGVSKVTWWLLEAGGFFIFIGACFVLAGLIRTFFGVGVLSLLKFSWLTKPEKTGQG